MEQEWEIWEEVFFIVDWPPPPQALADTDNLFMISPRAVSEFWIFFIW